MGAKLKTSIVRSRNSNGGVKSSGTSFSVEDGIDISSTAAAGEFRLVLANQEVSLGRPKHRELATSLCAKALRVRLTRDAN